MPKGTFHIYNDTCWARCPCGWSWEGGDNGRNTKSMVKKLHAKKCDIYAWCLKNPEHFVEDVMTYQGGGNPEGRLDLGMNMNGNGLNIGDLVSRVDAISMTDAIVPTADDIDERRKKEKKAQENRKKRLAKKRAKAKREAEKQ